MLSEPDADELSMYEWVQLVVYLLLIVGMFALMIWAGMED